MPDFGPNKEAHPQNVNEQTANTDRAAEQDSSALNSASFSPATAAQRQNLMAEMAQDRSEKRGIGTQLGDTPQKIESLQNSLDQRLKDLNQNIIEKHKEIAAYQMAYLTDLKTEAKEMGFIEKAFTNLDDINETQQQNARLTAKEHLDKAEELQKLADQAAELKVQGQQLLEQGQNAAALEKFRAAGELIDAAVKDKHCDQTRFRKANSEIGKELDNTMANVEATEHAARNTMVAAAATGATVATGGLAGGITAAMGSLGTAAVAGVGAGAAWDGIKTETEIQMGAKSRKEGWSGYVENLGGNAVQDLENSAIAAVTAGAGVGASRVVAAAAGKAAGAGIQVAAGAAAGAASSVVGNSVALVQEYNALSGEFQRITEGHNLSQEQYDQKFKEFLNSHDFTPEKITKRFGVNLAAGIFGGAIGAGGFAARGGTTLFMPRALAIKGGEIIASAAVGLGAAAVSEEGLTPANITSEIGNVIISDIIGEAAARHIENCVDPNIRGRSDKIVLSPETLKRLEAFGGIEEVRKSHMPEKGYLDRDPQTLKAILDANLSGDTRVNSTPATALNPYTVLERFHGSSSGDSLNIISKGLIPFGELERKGAAPFGGEMENGIQPERGVNNSYISTTNDFHIDGVVEHLDNNLRPWNPEIGLRNIQVWEEATAKIKAKAASSTDHQLTSDSRIGLAIAEKNIEAEFRRIEAWGKLSDLERSLISEPFGIIYGLKPKGKEIPVMGVSGEIGVGKTGPEEMIMYVPGHKVELMKAIVRKLGQKIPVKPYAEIPDNANYLSTFGKRSIADLIVKELPPEMAELKELYKSTNVSDKLKAAEIIVDKKLPEASLLLGGLLEQSSPYGRQNKELNLRLSELLAERGDIHSVQLLSEVAQEHSDPAVKTAAGNAIDSIYHRNEPGISRIDLDDIILNMKPGEEIQIGRSSNSQVVIKDPEISRNHITIRRTHNLHQPFFITDGTEKGPSRNGVFLRNNSGMGREGGQFMRVETPQYPAEPGSYIRLGDHVEFRIPYIAKEKVTPHT